MYVNVVTIFSPALEYALLTQGHTVYFTISVKTSIFFNRLSIRYSGKELSILIPTSKV